MGPGAGFGPENAFPKASFTPREKFRQPKIEKLSMKIQDF